MIGAVPAILSRIVEHKLAETGERKASLPHLEAAAEASVAARRDFARALRTSPPAIIAECKKASPSKGLLAANYDAPALARQYEAGGAAALSVLTDEKFFQGSLADLECARKATSLPALRKDFTLDEFHVVEAAAHGADAILLIAAILPASRLRDLRELAARYRMAALVEVHTETELMAAIESGAEIIGVNNRDLNTFEVSLETALRLAEKIPSTAIRVAESGIHTASDIRRLAASGFQAFLVGEHLVKSGDPAAAVGALRS
ncbi:MAG: indole-3-glycerol phosphate synthase TrpC [Bryobacteraceae bacterium]|nr:indole-3-glycerol phosphate synthase TrpC [Bryobacteraceae bacterium]